MKSQNQEFDVEQALKVSNGGRGFVGLGRGRGRSGAEDVEEESTNQVLNVSSVTSRDTIKLNVLYGKKMQTMLSLKMVNCF